MPIQEMIDKTPNYVEPEESFTIVWGRKKIGFGEFHFYIGQDHKVHCRNEIMSRKFIKDCLNEMVDNCVLDEPASITYREDKKE